MQAETMLQILRTTHSEHGMYKEAEQSNFKGDCSNRQQLLREPNYVDPEKVNGPILNHHCKVA